MDDADEPADQTNLTDGFDFQLKKNPVAVVNSTERTGENLKGDESKIEEQETNSITGMVEQFEKGDVSLKQEQNGDKIIPFLESASTNTQISLLGVKSLQEHSLSFQHLRGDKLNSPPSFERKGERESGTGIILVNSLSSNESIFSQKNEDSLYCLSNQKPDTSTLYVTPPPSIPLPTSRFSKNLKEFLGMVLRKNWSPQLPPQKFVRKMLSDHTKKVKGVPRIWSDLKCVVKIFKGLEKEFIESRYQQAVTLMKKLAVDLEVLSGQLADE
eukprot:TRINITY_DN5975_c0_g2_i3.p1 TRINITY_DN5975_c0_g2~~TRINITY_DN5975_c0_g2_i3.p1  ORF type:complete len:271 (-),score=86.74 TRINITY_DN5975_c0_g2_i3:17-829(-)